MLLLNDSTNLNNYEAFLCFHLIPTALLCSMRGWNYSPHIPNKEIENKHVTSIIFITNKY